MAYTFDSLGYAKRLRDRGVPNDQAEAHAEAARDFIMPEIATKADVLALKTDLLATEQRLQTEFHTRITALETKLDSKIDNLALRLTVRLGAMIVVAIGALATLLKLS
jgi:hypothetical protein